MASGHTSPNKDLLVMATAPILASKIKISSRWRHLAFILRHQLQEVAELASEATRWGWRGGS